jgi:hypothetical protein
MEKHQQSNTSTTKSRQREIDLRAVERAENEGMTASPVAGNHLAPSDGLRRGRPHGWFDVRTLVSADIK